MADIKIEGVLGKKKLYDNTGVEDKKPSFGHIFDSKRNSRSLPSFKDIRPVTPLFNKPDYWETLDEKRGEMMLNELKHIYI